MYPEHSFRQIKRYFMFGGIYDPKKVSDPRMRRLLYFWNTFLMIFCLVYSYPCEFTYVMITIDNLYEFLNNIGVLFTITLGVLKWFTILRHRHTFYDIMDLLEDPKFHYEDCKDYKPGEMMFKCKKFSRVMFVMFLLAGYLVAFVKYINFGMIYKEKGHLIGVENSNVTCSKMLPFYGMMRFNIETPTRCLVGFALQAFPVSSYVGPIIGFDLTFNVIALHTRAHFLNIRDGFRTMRERCVARLGLPEDYAVLRDTDNPALEREIRAESRKLSVHLQEMIDVIYRMDSACKYILLGQTFTSIFSLVTCLYIVSVEPLFSEMFMVQAQYAWSINVELFTYCLMGSEITSVSNDVSTGIYAADWLSCTKSVKSTLIINLLRLQKPIYYTIGDFSPLSLDTFTSFIKGSYSYYTFLDKT